MKVENDEVPIFQIDSIHNYVYNVDTVLLHDVVALVSNKATSEGKYSDCNTK